ncbi:hypothetical protein QZM57_33380 [Burkholderia cenocepacia]|nr:hypothetical protein [Burkholderia cenocepacia]MDN7457917.1 hypothetical protein [Burkholderia cenocepacia]
MNRAIDMAFRGEMQYGTGLVLGKQRIERATVANIDGPVRFLVCRGHETITEITSYDRCNRDQEEQEPEGAEAVPR